MGAVISDREMPNPMDYEHGFFAPWSKICRSVIKILIGAVMLGVGLAYREECHNGVTTFLTYGGSFLLIANLPVILFNLTCRMVKSCEEKGGGVEIPFAIGCYMAMCIFCGFILDRVLIYLADLTCIIWGTIVLALTYSQWTDVPAPPDSEEIAQYCTRIPYLVFAITLVINWIQTPLLGAWALYEWRKPRAEPVRTGPIPQGAGLYRVAQTED